MVIRFWWKVLGNGKGRLKGIRPRDDYSVRLIARKEREGGGNLNTDIAAAELRTDFTEQFSNSHSVPSILNGRYSELFSPVLVLHV